MDEGLPTAEKERLLAEYRRREAEVPAERYAPWQPAEMLARDSRRRAAARLLRRLGVFPGPETACLEIGHGKLGWLGELVAWGVREERLAGVELDAARAEVARRTLPAADLRTGDAAALPFADESFGLAIASTVFSSVLDAPSRRRMADEVVRVLAPGGAFLFYDFRFRSPGNPAVRSVGRRELRELFPELSGEVRSLTLAPPLARLVAPWSYPLAALLETLPFFRTHLLAVLVKRGSPGRRPPGPPP